MDITEIQPMLGKGDHVRLHNEARDRMVRLGEDEKLANSTGVILETTIGSSGQFVHLLLLSNGDHRKIAEHNLTEV